MSVEQGHGTRTTNNLREILLALAVVAVFPALWYWWFLSAHERPLAPTQASFSTHNSSILESPPSSFSFEPAPQIFTDGSSGHAVFPYSVIPGGIRSGQELAEVAEQDPLVARHYAGFQLHNTRVIRLKKDRRVYVSYRLGDQIYWTRKKVTLHTGETLLTDGKNMARGRCGNRVSDSPKAPVSDKEPGARTMSLPVFVPDPLPPGFPAGEPPVARITLPPETFGPRPNVPPGGPFPPFFPPIFPGGPGTASNPPGPPPVPPIVSTPEPASGLLVALGFAGLAMASLLLKR